jgi:chromate transporter
VKFKTNLQLFLTMLKIGLFTFGGGYAMIALLENEFVTKRGWLEQEEFLDVAAIAESTPGPIAINSATYIGYKKAGILGSLVATLGMVLPSFCIIYAISLFFDAFLSLAAVACAFKGIQIAVIYLILSAGLRMLKKMKKTPLAWVILLATMLCMVTLTLLSVKLSTVVYILASGIAGVALWLIRRLRHGEKGGEA